MEKRVRKVRPSSIPNNKQQTLEESKCEDRKLKKKRKNQANDKYASHLLKLLSKVEEAYSINTVLENGLILSKLDISDYSRVIIADVKSLNKKEITLRNVKAGGLMASVAYINQLLKYKKLKKLDYTVYIGIEKLVGSLEKFLYKETSTKRALLELNALMELLKQREKGHANAKLTLAYRFLRLFYTLVAYDNRVDASIVADLILHQIKFGFEQKVTKVENKGA